MTNKIKNRPSVVWVFKRFSLHTSKKDGLDKQQVKITNEKVLSIEFYKHVNKKANRPQIGHIII